VSIRGWVGIWTLACLPLLFLFPAIQGLRFPLLCHQSAGTAFSMGPGTQPALGSSLADRPPLCGGLSVVVTLSRLGNRTVAIRPTISNLTARDWHGSVLLRITGLGAIPLSIGRVAAGSSRSAVATVVLPEGREDIAGELDLGP
jgi:hypothetical protein